MKSAPWQLLAFGKPRLLDPAGQAVRCEARTLALLSYLALEGPTPRSRLAGLLWPETAESAARNNLVHLLRRMAKSHHPDLIQAGEAVALGTALDSDLRGWTEGSHTASAEVPGGALLDGLSFDEQPDLAEWLLAQRERLDAARVGRLAAAAASAEDAGDLEGAVALARRLLDLDPLSEDGWRRLMRLHYLSGDRPAALRAYHRCQEVLARELGVDPLPETRELARLIDQGAVQGPARPAAPRIPLAVRRPPVLVGRADAWAQMDAAWARGQGVILMGEPGVGKTRLALDFLAEHGGGMRFEGRPGDAGLLYATHARTYGQVLAAYPDLELPDWVRGELSRILPALGAAPKPSPRKPRNCASGRPRWRCWAGPWRAGCATWSLTTCSTWTKPAWRRGLRVRPAGLGPAGRPVPHHPYGAQGRTDALSGGDAADPGGRRAGGPD
ncbi:AfsR/SARP family transcriptional regulator [Deinococcus multiflagellatus]|uniref:BTAD domain-containing putative transcriptional regulator n=1 Tax=Deinococcus multiflagellatus TaxID=1656887 RepID=A0ABW1ZRY7_9DEIO